MPARDSVSHKIVLSDLGPRGPWFSLGSEPESDRLLYLEEKNPRLLHRKGRIFRSGQFAPIPPGLRCVPDATPGTTTEISIDVATSTVDNSPMGPRCHSQPVTFGQGLWILRLVLSSPPH